MEDGSTQIENGPSRRQPQSNDEQFRLLVQGVQDYAIFLLDSTGHVASWNAGAERIKQYRHEDIVGKHFSTFYTAEDLATNKPARELEIASRTGKYEEEGWRLRKDGSRFWANVLITAIKDAEGKVLGFSKVTRDLTERRRFEETLKEKNRQLEMAIQARDRFLATMSHELRTPLNAIIGFTGTLLMKLPGPLLPEQEKQLRTVQRSAKHLLSLINDLLDLAKINSGKTEMRPQPVNCQEVIQEVAGSLEPAAAARNLRIETAFPPEDVVVSCDRRALSQILLNLGTNALKFSDRGTVKFELARTTRNGRPAVTVSVQDQGIGIRPEDQARLFRAFTQVGDSVSRERGGSGMGLYLSQRLADLMNGRLELDSEFGQGSRFTLVLDQE